MKQDHIDRGGQPSAWQAFNALRACRAELGLSRGALQSLQAMISFLKDGQGTIVHASNRSLSERAACCDRSLRRHIAQLERLGLLQRISSPNNKRFRLFNPDGEDLAFGMDLAPMVQRVDEFAALVEERAARTARIRLMHQRIRIALARRTALESPAHDCDLDAPPAPGPVAPSEVTAGDPEATARHAPDELDAEIRRVLRRTTDLQDLASIAQHLETTLAAAPAIRSISADEPPAPLAAAVSGRPDAATPVPASASARMSASNGQAVRHIQDQDKEDLLKMTAEKLAMPGSNRIAQAARWPGGDGGARRDPVPGTERPIGLDEIRRSCPDALSHALSPVQTMADVLQLAWSLAPQVGIGEALLRRACAERGAEIPLLTVLGIVQRIRTIRCAGAYFRALFFGRRAASFRLSSLFADI